MKAEVRYARFYCGSITKVDLIGNYVYWKNKDNRKVCIHKDNVSLANTPQELIKEKDLVELKNSNGRLLQVDELHHDIQCVKFDDRVIGYEEIAKLLTPNSNGGYDLQYESEETK